MRVELTGIQGAAGSLDLPPGAAKVIGRGERCDLQILDKKLSREHCRLENRDGQIVLVDLGSHNGCFVNGVRVQEQVLGFADDIQIGSLTLQLVADMAQAAESVEAVEAAAVAEAAGLIDAAAATPAADPRESRVSASRAPAAGVGLLGERGYTSSDLAKAQRALQSIFTVTNIVNGAVGLERVLETAIGAMLEVSGAERGALLMRDSTTKEIAPAIIRKRSDASDETPLAFSRTIVDEAVTRGRSVRSDDAADDPRFKDGRSVVRQRIRSVMCVPLRSHEEVIGAAYVDTSKPGPTFSDGDLEVLTVIGQQVGMAIARARLLDDLTRLFVGAVRVISASIAAKDKYTHGHAERVTAYSLALAEALGLSEKEQQGVWLAGLLHDVGKIGVPDSVLNKPGALDDHELAEIRKHPLIGDEIVSHIPAIRDMVQGGIRFHHERWDGRGYPEGLRGEAIPLYARIMAVADTFDAMTSDRAYRKGLPVSVAIDEISRNAGAQFDPRVVDAFMLCHAAGKLAGSANVFARYFGPKPAPGSGEPSR